MRVVLDRLVQMPTAAAEHGVIRSYLEWMADLPWAKTSEDRLDVDEARRILDEDHFGLEKVKEVFGWLKTIGCLGKLHHRGRERVDAVFTLATAAYNLIRIRNLTATS